MAVFHSGDRVSGKENPVFILIRSYMNRRGLEIVLSKHMEAIPESPGSFNAGSANKEIKPPNIQVLCVFVSASLLGQHLQGVRIGQEEEGV